MNTRYSRLFCLSICVGLALAGEAAARGELTSAQIRYLVTDTEWEIHSQCSQSEMWSGLVTFSKDGTVHAETVCDGSYVHHNTRTDGRWVVKDNQICFEDVETDGLDRSWGNRDEVFASGTCRTIVKEDFGFRMVFSDGRNDWLMQLKKHPEHDDLDKLAAATRKAATSAVAQVAAAPQPRSVSAAAADSAMWEEIMFSNRISDFQRYLAKYPNGLFVSLAENQIRDLIKRQNQGGEAATVDTAGIQFGAYHALVIGINSYKHLPKLETAINDAESVAGVLERDYGFQVRLLLDPTRNDIIDAFDDYLETLGAADNLLIYYAGHGWLDGATDRGYWLPVDAKEGRRSRWLSNADITDTLKSLAAKHVMVVADSCYSGTLTRSASVGLRDNDYLRRMASKKARVAMVSGGLEPVADSGGGGNSPFAKAFIGALEGNDSVIDGTRLFSHIRRPVILHAQQTPEYSDVRNSGHDGGDFLFVRRK